MELYLQSPIRFKGVVLSKLQGKLCFFKLLDIHMVTVGVFVKFLKLYKLIFFIYVPTTSVICCSLAASYELLLFAPTDTLSVHLPQFMRSGLLLVSPLR